MASVRTGARCAPLGAILAVAAVLLFADLGDGYLWQDEAETAVVARTILSRGVPYGTDGRNYFSQEMIGEELGRGPWRAHPWLQFYAAAASFSLLGAGTFATRAPFALFGLLAVAAIYAVAREQFRGRRTALIAAGLASVSVPFMILCRQGRYYSAVALFFLLSVWGYARLVKGARHSAWVLVVAATLTFHSYHPACLVLMTGLALHAALFHRDRMKTLLIVLAVTAAVNVPWLFWLRTYQIEHQRVFSASRIAGILPMLRDGFGVFLAAACVIAAALVILALRGAVQKRIPAGMRDLVDPISLHAILIAGVVVASLIPNAPFFRYWAPALPLLFILMAVVVNAAFEAHALFGAAVIATLVATQPLHKLVHEITHDFEGPIEGIVRYLNEHAESDDIVLVTYGDLPLKFYTPLRIVGGLTGESLEPARESDWIILRKHVNSPDEERVRRFVEEEISLSDDYRGIVIDYPDTPFENRESLREHYFESVVEEDRVVLHRKLR